MVGAGVKSTYEASTGHGTPSKGGVDYLPKSAEQTVIAMRFYNLNINSCVCTALLYLQKHSLLIARSLLTMNIYR